MHLPISLLAVPSGFAELVEKYFSFIILGLVLTVGYVVWRLYGGTREKPEGTRAEEILREAEADARRRKDIGEHDLELSPEQRLQLKELGVDATQAKHEEEKK